MISALDSYKNDVEKISSTHGILSKDDEIRLSNLVQKGDKEAKRIMIEANLRLVFFAARKRSFDNAEFEELVSAGNLGLIRAVEKFDPSLGNRFSTYACIWIDSKISNIKVRSSYRGGSEDAYLFFKLNKTKEKFFSENGYPITDNDLADMLEISIDKLYAITSRGNIRMESMNQESNDDGEALNLEEKIADNKEHMDDVILKREIKDIANVILNNCINLTEKERFAIVHFFGIGLHHGYTFTDISKTMKLSAERVRQIFEKAMRKIKYTVFNHNITTYSFAKKSKDNKNISFSKVDI